MVMALCSCWCCLPDGLYSALLSLSWQLSSSVTSPWDQSVPVYPVNVTGRKS